MNLDRKAWIGVALCLLALVFYRPLLHLVGWDRYLEPPQRSTPAAVQAPARDTMPPPAPGAAPETAARVLPPPQAPQRAEARLFRTPEAGPERRLEQTYDIETPLYRATFSNRGARLLSYELKKFATAHGASSRNHDPVRVRPGTEVPAGDRVVLGGGPLFGLDLGSGAGRHDLGGVVFAVSESLAAGGERVALHFTAQDSGGAFVRQSYRVRPGDYALDLEVEIRGVNPSWRLDEYSLTVRSWPLFTEADELSDARSLRSTSLVGANLRREAAPGLVNRPKTFEGNAQWAAVQTRYFMNAVAVSGGTARRVVSSATRRPFTEAEQENLPPQRRQAEMEVAENSLTVALPSELAPVHRFVLYAGPCDYFRLSALGLQFEKVVDLGWGWVQPFSRALLRLMIWLHGLVRNYGVAIILLATLVRIVLHPLNMMSMRSMRAMQKLQPEIERLRAKYKDNAQAMNTAMMALYKENKVNPAGGCLPMLLQLPLFIALYSVLFNAVELRHAPFFAWIHDLSAPDLLFSIPSFDALGLHLGPFPIRLLPLLMAASGLWSQALTPTDPRQMPTMYIMNIVMLVFFYGLPSGLVLYWTLMNVLTGVQQWMVLRQDSHVRPVPATAAPPARGKPHRK
jgi:YidC/Oxa1 family membrane protein insertase